jgi:exodeoxyribonuclease VII large subunit
MQTPLPTASPPAKIYAISELNGAARRLLEENFHAIWVSGEISNLAKPSSGHFYFSLKDGQAQVRCAMFRQHNLGLRFTPKEGMQVLVRANVSLYEGRGDFQLIVSQMEPAGDGALQQAFEALKQRLGQAGLFKPEHKKPLPRLPKTIGVITSPTGAAIRDVLSVIARRCPSIPVIIYPCLVQGKLAGASIKAAIETAVRRAEAQVLLLVRGGGSLEDLWPFNEEIVAEALFACPIPVVSGVGHEVDITIADFVADARAPTPTAAAELVTPLRQELLQQLQEFKRRLALPLQKHLQWQTQHLEHLTKRLQHPLARLSQQMQQLDEFSRRLERAMQERLFHHSQQLQTRAASLGHHNPRRRLALESTRLTETQHRLQRAGESRLQTAKQRLALLMNALHTVSPLATLQRGYAIVSNEEGAIITQSTSLKPGERIHAQLAQGQFHARVESSEA